MTSSSYSSVSSTSCTSDAPRLDDAARFLGSRLRCAERRGGASCCTTSRRPRSRQTSRSQRRRPRGDGGAPLAPAAPYDGTAQDRAYAWMLTDPLHDYGTHLQRNRDLKWKGGVRSVLALEHSARLRYKADDHQHLIMRVSKMRTYGRRAPVCRGSAESEGCMGTRYVEKENAAVEVSGGMGACRLGQIDNLKRALTSPCGLNTYCRSLSARD
ncbi:hypothetical protein B0H15DRAFT_820950 [Mycena belliarum]|uniref:Uncharacterized protein n=1 Tax=Mycena belliarum TaxID=1033014 RepID=A0AAD6XZ41_9AGAR|nr:hypothetical protein B0H15DRAFT_820950 [Mycena belliae]